MDWTETYFGVDYLRLHPAHLDRSVNAREALGAMRCLGIRPPSRLLDVGCGFGRHALPLAEAGYDVVGVDASDPLLTRARRDAATTGAVERLRFVHQDYRDLTPEDVGGPVSSAICLFTSIGYAERTDDLAALRAVFDCLSPGGRFLLDIANHARTAELDRRRTWSEHEADGERWFILESFTFDRISRILSAERILIEADGAVRRFPFQVRSYTLNEAAALLREVGFRILATYGSLDGAPFVASSPRLVLLAERPG